MTAPMNIRLHILEESTNGFSASTIIGRGGYGDVFKGVLPNRDVIAVKLLHDDPVHVLDDEKFNNEVVNLLRVEHPNIVRLRGYCCETQQEFFEHNGETRSRKRIYRVLCFEYLQDGSLDRHLHARTFAPDWSTRYNIIKGICEGLNFLHGCKPPIFHLDLKPANILLDSSMVPKVADFGLSRLFNRSHTHVTNKIIGTPKYMPPEFISGGVISEKNDVFSFGVVIVEIIAGHTSPSISSEMADLTQLMQEVHTKWKKNIEVTSEYPSEELHQVQTCIDTAVSCMDPEKKNRPTIADILDILNKTETHIPKRQLIDVPMNPAIGAKNTMGNMLMRARDEHDNITDVNQNCSFMGKYNNSCVQQVGNIRETTSSMKEALIIGRTEEKDEILCILSGSSTQEITFLPIYGIGGIGKTTMAQLVFNDFQFKEYSRVWIYVSQTFDLKKIGNSIIAQLSGNKSKHTDLQMIQNSLHKLLSGNRVLIILDDLWEREPSQLEKLVSMLNLDVGGKLVVVVTTREEFIAQNIHTDTVKPYKLAPLSDDTCLTIIKNKSQFESRAERVQLELIGKEIAKKCGGVALAAQSIGYMLYAMEFDEWESVNNSEIWDVLASGESTHHVHASLLLSYQIMDPYLKLCFAYCGTFPKGHWIAKEDLAHQWVALGLVKPSITFSYIQTSHKYIRHLFGMCFFEHPRSSFLSQIMDVDNFLIMHDLVHDLARSVLADKANIESPSCRYAWLTDHTKLFKSLVNPLAKITALHFLDRANLQLQGEAFSAAKCLLVLDLSRCYTQELPDSICQLKQLRYLDASWYLDYTPSSYQSPPESILIPKDLGSLSELQYLNLSNRRTPIGLPEVISKLTELRYLNLSHCSMDNPSANQSLIDCISSLPNLEQLDMSFNHYSFCIPESFSKLRKLNLAGCDHIDSLPENVGKVDNPRLFGLLKVFRVHVVDGESRSNLVWLKPTNPDLLRIVDLENVKSVEEARSIRLMEKKGIETLTLNWGHGVRFVEQMDLLTELVPPSSVKNFMITGYKGVSLPHWCMHISKYLPNLVSLELWGLQCSILPTLVQLPNLRKIVLAHMSNLEEFNTACSMGEDGANELTVAKLEHLEIYECPKVRIKPCPPRAVYWYLLRSDNVLSSWGERASSTIASSSSSLVTELKIEHSTLPLCEWRLLHHLAGLSDLTIAYCYDLTISPQITHAFTSLKSLSLGIHGLKKLPGWLGELTSLRQLNLERYYSLEEFHENMRQLTQLQSLSLKNCEKLTSLPEWLGELTLLKTLKIHTCEAMISLPQSILDNLQELHIWDCPKLYQWCTLEENQMKLVHIKGELYPGLANEHRGYLKNVLLETAKRNAASGSKVENRGKKPMNIKGTIDLTNVKEVGDSSAASIQDTLIDEVDLIDEKNQMKLPHIRKMAFTKSTINKNGKKPTNTEETIELTNMTDAIDNLATSNHGGATDEVHPDLYSAVIDVPGFTEGALLVALSHLMDNTSQGSAYMGMQEKDRVSWLMNFLKRHY